MKKTKIIIIVISLLALAFAVQGCSPKLSIEDNVHPLYLTTAKGFTIIDTRTGKIVVKDFDPNISDSVAGFYKTLLFTEYSGSDFPINVSPRTNMIDLKTGREKKIVDDQLSFLKKEGHFLYGIGGEYELIFIYDTLEKKFLKVKSSDPELSPIFTGFVSLNNGRRAVVLDGQIKSLDGKKNLPHKTISASLIADDNKLVYLGGKNVSVQDVQANKTVNFKISLPAEPTAFYANERLYIGESTSAEEKPKLSTYKVYGLTDGKLIKKLKMDVRDYNTLKVNDLIVFLEGPHKGSALNLKTSEIEKTSIAEQSVVQDGKIYSVVKDSLVIRRVGKILKTIKLSESVQKKWNDDTSIYNRAIYSSQPTNDNFRIFESLY